MFVITATYIKKVKGFVRWSFTRQPMKQCRTLIIMVSKDGFGIAFTLTFIVLIVLICRHSQRFDTFTINPIHLSPKQEQTLPFVGNNNV